MATVTMKKAGAQITVSATRRNYYETLGYVVVKSEPVAANPQAERKPPTNKPTAGKPTATDESEG
ncbi:MAG: hypothetical protein FWE08_03810 [Oscillospiraceae bacterium]|nr:hypothetical protein [Oscillospiraceae bacterium]